MSFLSPRGSAAEKSAFPCRRGGRWFLNLVDCQAAAVMCRRWWRNHGWHQLVYIEVGSTGSTWRRYRDQCGRLQWCSCSTTVLYTQILMHWCAVYSLQSVPWKVCGGLQNMHGCCWTHILDLWFIGWVLTLNTKGDVRLLFRLLEKYGGLDGSYLGDRLLSSYLLSVY